MFRKAFTSLALVLATASAVAQSSAPEQVDVVALRAETRQLEQKMYELFNSLNSSDEFDVTCAEHKVTGSAIPAWECEAAFMRDARSRSVASRFDNPLAASANTQGGFIPQSTRQTGFNQRKKVEQLNEEMMALARQHPELASAMIALNAKRQQLEAAEK